MLITSLKAKASTRGCEAQYRLRESEEKVATFKEGASWPSDFIGEVTETARCCARTQSRRQVPWAMPPLTLTPLCSINLL